MGKGFNEHKMENTPISKLVITSSVPLMISTLVSSLYGLVDSMFVARISEKALTAITLAYPVQNIITGIGLGTGIGLNSLLARSLGEKDEENLSKVNLEDTIEFNINEIKDKVGEYNEW